VIVSYNTDSRACGLKSTHVMVFPSELRKTENAFKCQNLLGVPISSTKLKFSVACFNLNC
jgi:hypothetical protein